MSVHKEISFEKEICDHLAARGWLYADGDAKEYDRARALFPADVLAWVQGTQPQAWETLTKNHGARAGETLLTRVRDQIDQRGTLDVLRYGVELLGLKQSLKLAEFKPALAINPDMLGTADPRREAAVEQALIDHVQDFLLELGAGFAFVGRQVPLEVGDSDFKIDLLFYHFKLHCFVVEPS